VALAQNGERSTHRAQHITARKILIYVNDGSKKNARQSNLKSSVDGKPRMRRSSTWEKTKET
jgi:hypothetical protein